MSRARRTGRNGRWLARGLVAALLGVTACDAARYGYVSMGEVNGTPGATLDAGRIIVPEGGVLVFRAEPRTDPGAREYLGLERFELLSREPSTAQVRHSILADTWVVNGVAVGSTELDVLVDGEVVDAIAVEVSPSDEEGAP